MGGFQYQYHMGLESDAHRRDLTINALFCNINERRVEDFTCCGIEDTGKNDPHCLGVIRNDTV